MHINNNKLKYLEYQTIFFSPLLILYKFTEQKTVISLNPGVETVLSFKKFPEQEIR